MRCAWRGRHEHDGTAGCRCSEDELRDWHEQAEGNWSRLLQVVQQRLVREVGPQAGGVDAEEGGGAIAAVDAGEGSDDAGAAVEPAVVGCPPRPLLLSEHAPLLTRGAEHGLATARRVSGMSYQRRGRDRPSATGP